MADVSLLDGARADFDAALDGETIAVVTLRAEQVRAVQHDEIAHARSIDS